jgi:hypothetical protein
MAGFRLVKNMNEMVLEKVRVASQAYTKGDAVMRDTSDDTVDVVPATSSTGTDRIYGIAHETVASSATELQVAVIEPSQVWECETANAVDSGHNFQKMVLTDANTVNNTGTDSVADAAVVLQVGVSGAKGLFKFRGDAT